MRLWLIFWLLFGHLAIPDNNRALSQSTVEISDVSVIYAFGEQAIFQAKIHSNIPIQQTFLFILPEGQSTRIVNVSLDSQGQTNLQYDIKNNPLRPYARVAYWYRVTTADGSILESQKYSFDYIDNRFKWQNLDDSNFQINWYERDLAFGQEALNQAEAGLQSAEKYLPVTPTSAIKVYIYNRASDLQSALQLGQQSWVAGEASPDLRVVLISIPTGPDQNLEMERQIPHEITHILQYQVAGTAYQQLPTWLIEGTASIAELYPDPDYQVALNKATTADTLLPIQTLCASFPRDASSAYLAYAESASFMRMIHDKYGSSGIQALMKKYEDGMGCDEGAMAALGSSLEQLQVTWKQEMLGVDSQSVAWKNLAPYLLILALLLAVPLTVIIRLVRKPKVPKAEYEAKYE
ncbi:MAG: peptidase MA family metallohydrolase [Anaerolineaceae bacterium]|nr:peptidase MA family metallohydrolase [Anaerolineaceae bacterium]